MSTANETQTQYALSDTVLHRIVQILQLAMMTGIDIADYMREIRLTHAVEDSSFLVMTDEYNTRFKALLQELSAEANQRSLAVDSVPKL